MGQHEARQLILVVFDVLRVRHDDVDTGMGAVAKGDAQINHDPFCLARLTVAVQVEVHADFAGTAQGQEVQFIANVVFGHS